MIEMSLPEAQLFRLLVGFFGKDRVVYSMSARAVCGGAFAPSATAADPEVPVWADSVRCLFTVVDDADEPKMVVELAPNLDDFIEVARLERDGRLPHLLKAHGIQYLSITNNEMNEMLDPEGTLDLIAFLKDKLNVEDGDGCSDEEPPESSSDY